MADGKVEYEVSLNTGNLDKDLDSAEQKTESTLDGISETAGKTGKRISASFLAVGSAVVAVGGKAISGAVNLDKAMNQFAASTGTAESELDGYEDTLKSLYANNYGESFEDIGNAMATITQQMGKLDQATLENVTESAFALRDTFGYEINESIRSASTLMTQFGISGDKAMSLIATGAQNGLDFSGELLDSINEYSVHFKKVGLDADDMFKIMEKGAETGAWNLDKIGDAIKEMSIRVIDGSDTTKQGFAAIGLNADEMAKKFAAGGDSAKEAFDKTISALANMKDPLAQNTAGVNLFGTMWEDLGPEVVSQLASIEDGAYASAEAMSEIKKVKYDDLGSMLEGLKRSFELLLIPIGEALIPLLNVLAETIAPIIEVISDSLSPILEQLSEVILLLSEPLGVLIEFLGQVLGIAMQLLSEALTPILDVLIQILEPITQLLNEIFEPIMEMLTAIMEPLSALINAALQPILTLITSLIEPLTSLVEMILPILQDLFAELTPIITSVFDALTPLFNIFTEIAEFISGILGPVIEKLAGILTGVLGGAIDAIMPIIEGLVDVFSSVVDFLVNVFSGNWEAAWDGIVNIFRSIFNLIPTIVESIINGAIDVINLLIKGVNSLIGWLGIGEIPLIAKVKLPRFHTGGIVDFEEGEGLAMLKKGEMVLTQQQQAELFAIANGAAPRGDAMGSDRPLYADITLTGNVEMDGLKVGRVFLRNLDDAAAFTLRG